MHVDRRAVLAYRTAAQGLDRASTAVAGLAILDLGVQEAMGQPAALAFAARVGAPVALPPVGPGHRLALAWSLRGAPHLHRRDGLDDLAAALRPASEADAARRLNETGPAVARAGITALDQFDTAVRAMAEVVTRPTAKGAASTAVTERLPPPMRHPCRACATRHVSDSAMRAALLPAGLELEPGTNPPVLVPRAGAASTGSTDRAALTRLVRRFLELSGPSTPGAAADHFGMRTADLREAWPDDLAEVAVDGRAAWLPQDRLDELRAAVPAHLVRLLGPFDPFVPVSRREREWLVPDPALRKRLWPVLGRPGLVMADDEIVGSWRTASARSTLTVTVEVAAPLSPHAWSSVEDEAAVIAGVRGADDVRVVRAG